MYRTYIEAGPYNISFLIVGGGGDGREFGGGGGVIMVLGEWSGLARYKGWVALMMQK